MTQGARPLSQLARRAEEGEVIAEVGTALADNTLQNWIVAGGILAGGFVAARLGRWVLERALRQNGHSFFADLIGRLLSYVILAFSAVYALEEIGVAVAPVLGALGVIGIALAFAMQSILENFVAGILLQIRRPFTKGDEIESLDFSGTVRSVDARTMTVLTPDGEVVRLPNAEVIDAPISNLSQNGRRRTEVTVGVAYGSDVAHAAEVARTAAANCSAVLVHPAPSVFAKEFGPSSIDLVIMFWHGPAIREVWSVRHQVIVAVSEAFAEHEITIPFPQRTLHMAPSIDDPSSSSSGPLSLLDAKDTNR